MNLLIRISLIAASVFVLAACGSTRKIKKITSEYEKIIDSLKTTLVNNVVDTIEVTKEKIITEVVSQYIEIPIECDSIGNVKPVKYKTSTGPVNSSFSIENNKIIFDTKIDSIVNYYEKEYRNRLEKETIKIEQRLKEKYSIEKTETKKVTKYPWYWKVGLWVLGIIVLLIIGFRVYKKLFFFI